MSKGVRAAAAPRGDNDRTSGEGKGPMDATGRQDLGRRAAGQQDSGEGPRGEIDIALRVSGRWTLRCIGMGRCIEMDGRVHWKTD